MGNDKDRKLRATADGQKLFVRDVLDTHNHDISEAEFRFHPKQRKLDPGSQEEIASLLALEPDKQLLRRRLMEVTGKVILMKDIHNIKTRLLRGETKISASEKSLREMTGPVATETDVVDKAKRRSQPCQKKTPLRSPKKAQGESKGLLGGGVEGDSFVSTVLLPESQGEESQVVLQVPKKADCLPSSQQIILPAPAPVCRQAVAASTGRQNQTWQVGNNIQCHTSALVCPLQQVSHTLPPATAILQPNSAGSCSSTKDQQNEQYQRHQNSCHHYQQQEQYYHPEQQQQQQQQLPPVLQPPSMYTINIHRIHGDQVYSVGALQQQQDQTFSFSTSAVINSNLTNTASAVAPSGMFEPSAIISSPVTTVILDDCTLLQNNTSLLQSSNFVHVDHSASKSHDIPWVTLDGERAGKASHLQSIPSGSGLQADPTVSLSPIETVPSNTANHQSSKNNVEDHLSHRTTNSAVPSTSISTLSVLADSNSSGLHQSSFCNDHLYQQQHPEHHHQQQQHILQGHVTQHRQQTPNQSSLPSILNSSTATQAALASAAVHNKNSSSPTPNSKGNHFLPTASGETKRKCSARKKECPQKVGQARVRRSANQADRDNLMRKYFQQATVNLFFNERLKYSGNKLFKIFNTAGARMSNKQAELKYNDALKPLAWLFGKWRGEQGRGKYPTIQDFSYTEEAEFSPIGMQPNVEFKLYSFKPDTNAPMHRETGFVKIKPGTNHIAFVAAHNLGVIDIQEGEVSGQELNVTSHSVGRTTFNKDPIVKVTKRRLKRINDELELVMEMETDKTELTEHLRITYTKI
ncbi:THAP domain-containing protein 4 [Plakobranchus ocellatus]|uniref:THAP domain-containing protein 4 n=1 Tax=Plakobranchus ocellatus TaxID=259542 RepID=A0AAV4CFE3_9GAST|nr:THAP domain-containing protein 4 [Plakobranchus ocellatus]